MEWEVRWARQRPPHSMDSETVSLSALQMVPALLRRPALLQRKQLKSVKMKVWDHLLIWKSVQTLRKPSGFCLFGGNEIVSKSIQSSLSMSVSNANIQSALFYSISTLFRICISICSSNSNYSWNNRMIGKIMFKEDVYLKQQKEAVYSYLSGMGSFENHLLENSIIWTE